MPSETFFRLPVEKRQRLMDAAWSEFTETKYAEVSINRIIRKAGIPRGSFYQYFEDKEDLFFHLLKQVRQDIIDLTLPLLDGGDMFSCTLKVFDLLLEEGSRSGLERCMQVFRTNPDLAHRIFGESKDNAFLNLFLARADRTAFRSDSPEFLEQTFHFLSSSLGCALVASLVTPGEEKQQRAVLETRIDIIRTGSLKPEKEETP